MKKLFIALGVVCLLGGQGAFAFTSGACSSHGGVSCESGPGLNDNVQCADGWGESTVNFWDAVECKNYLCTKQQVLYDALIQKVDSSIGTSNLCQEAGLTGSSTINQCLQIRGTELRQQYESLWQTVDSYRNLCYQEKPALSQIPTTIKSTIIFTDVDGGTSYYDAIKYVKENSIVSGYPDGSFRPSNKINRAEFTKILMEAAFKGQSNSPLASFYDITPSDWFSPFVSLAKQKGIVEGYQDGTFRPNNNITAAEALKIILTAFYGDIPATRGEWYQKYLTFAANKKLLISSWADAVYEITRGEMAQLIYSIKKSSN